LGRRAPVFALARLPEPVWKGEKFSLLAKMESQNIVYTQPYSSFHNDKEDGIQLEPKNDSNFSKLDKLKNCKDVRIELANQKECRGFSRSK
jgi:hypothetical protein